jgi:CheY-like chemotaxis protein
MEISYEEASLSEIVREVADDTGKTITRQEKPIIMTVRNQLEDANDIVFTDRVWLKRVLNHLMDNAVKFTLEGSVELIYGLENSMIYFRVKDTGIGIKKENFSTIFEEFRQEIGGHHRPFEGLGVGLTLVREVVERMGGSVTVNSEKGFGSEFGILLPHRPAGTLKSKTVTELQSDSIRDWSTRKCLLVDDNKDVLNYLRRILLDTGIEVITARSGPEAIEAMRSRDGMIDIVLLDMQMPEMNGIEVTREIKKLKPSVPIIAQTAFIFEDDKDIILQAGCDACLIKPIRKEQLITVMGGFI